MTAPTTMSRGRYFSRRGSDHSHARQKGKSKFVFHVTRPLAAPSPAAYFKGTHPKLKPSEDMSGFHARQLNLREVALRPC
jgi:hypothetical protein